MEIGFDRLCRAAADLTGIPLKAAAPERADMLFPAENEFFSPIQFMGREEFLHLVHSLEAGDVLFIQDRAALCWFVLRLPPCVFMGGPYLTDMVTREDTLPLYETLFGKESGGSFYYERENENQRLFRFYLMHQPLIFDHQVQRLVAFLSAMMAWGSPVQRKEYSLLKIDYAGYRQDDFNRYLGYQEDCEAGLTASVAHASDRNILHILRIIYDFSNGDNSHDQELLRFASIAQLINSGARRANVPAAATKRVLRKYFDKVPSLTTKDEFLSMAETLAIEMNHLVQTCSNHLYSPLICSVLDRIRNGFTSPITLGSIAREFGVNESYLAGCFKRETGTTIGAFILGQRMEYARTLLTVSTLDIGEIGQRVGITDHSYFTRQFKKAYGVSPKAYREMLTH